MEELKEALARSESARLKLEEENHLLKGRLEQGEREKRDLDNKYMAEISKREILLTSREKMMNDLEEIRQSRNMHILSDV